jgi:hypothetical protein
VAPIAPRVVQAVPQVFPPFGPIFLLRPGVGSGPVAEAGKARKKTAKGRIEGTKRLTMGAQTFPSLPILLSLSRSVLNQIGDCAGHSADNTSGAGLRAWRG